MAQRDLLGPGIVALGEGAKLRFLMAPTIGTDVMTVKVINPNEVEFDITTFLRAIVPVSPATISHYVIDVTPDAVGDWYYEVRDATSGDWGACMVSVRQWAGNMDKPVSQVMKQRVDIDRLRTNIRNQGGR